MVVVVVLLLGRRKGDLEAGREIAGSLEVVEVGRGFDSMAVG